MARIIYGVQGVTHGHAMRALTLARHMGQHEFLFVTSEDAAELLGRDFRVEPCLNLTTIYKDYKTDVAASFMHGAKVHLHRAKQVRDLVRLIEDFKPDAAIYDYEYFVPQAAKRVGLPFLSLDHQHILTVCKHDLPRKWWLDYLLQSSSVRLFFSKARDYLVISFYQPPVKNGIRAQVSPPLLRDSVIRRTPSRGNHVLVYQSCSICDTFAPFLKTIDREFRIYGYGFDKEEGNLKFRSWSEEGLLEDLSTCDYVICGGGHTLISESLYYGKPVLSLPIKTAIEQCLNAIYLEKLGYGEHHDMMALSPDVIADFEKNVETYRVNIAGNNFFGNEEVFQTLEDFIRNGRL